MRTRNVVLVVALILSMATACYGERILDRAETLEILQQLTSRNQTTWISAGVIAATHQAYRAPVTMDPGEIESQIQQEIREYEANPDKRQKTEEMQQMYLEAIPFNVGYRLANESTMDSNVQVKYDGERFYWEIDVTSRSDSVEPTGDLVGNFMIQSFDLSWNEERIFAWDGEKYTIYSVSANHATVDVDDRFPHTVNGPLTAGVIPWGNGILTYESLSEADMSAIETDHDGTTQLQIRVEQADGSSGEFILDPARDYAVTDCAVARPDDTVTSVYYSDYQQVGSHWVPYSILIEKHDSLTNRLLRSDKWEITNIDGRTPGPQEFGIDYADNTFVEYYSSLGKETSSYRYSVTTDTDALLAEHLTYTATRGKQKQNCATAALKYAASQLGKSIPDTKLAQLVNSHGQTSMLDLKKCAERLGLHCRTLKSDLSTLKDLSDCQIILHQPGKNHFVVVDRVDDKQVWVVDLSNKKFYYPQDASSITAEGTAMLLSREPIFGQSQNINDAMLNTIMGADYWSCTLLLQEAGWIPCPGCVGNFYVFYERWGCETAPSGTCTTQAFPAAASVECYLDLSNRCIPLGDWTIVFMPACY